MSKTRRISSSSFASSAKSGFCQSMIWRVGASRLPSPVIKGSVQNRERKRPRNESAARPVSNAQRLLAESVERLLGAAGVGLLGLGQGLEPVGDLVKAFRARGLGHARIHVGVF